MCAAQPQVFYRKSLQLYCCSIKCCRVKLSVMRNANHISAPTNCVEISHAGLHASQKDVLRTQGKKVTMLACVGSNFLSPPAGPSCRTAASWAPHTGAAGAASAQDPSKGRGRGSGGLFQNVFLGVTLASANTCDPGKV
jgi:hypothetical protein